MAEELQWTAVGLMYVVVGVLVIAVSKVIMNRLTPYHLDEELTKKDNPALGITLAGYLAGVVIIYLGATIGPDPEEVPRWGAVLGSLGIDVLYALAGILALNLGRIIVDRAVLAEFSTVKEIIEDRNVGTAAVESGSAIATALIVAGAIHGEGSWISAVVFFVLGQAVLVLFGRFHQFITPYDVHAEIEKDNVAAGAFMGLNMIALGLILLKATAGSLITWRYNLSVFVLDAGLGFVVLLGAQKLLGQLLLRKTSLKQEIAEDRNLNVAWVGGMVSVSIAALVFFVM